MRKTNFVCGAPTAEPQTAIASLAEKIDELLKRYEFHDAVISPAQIVTSTTPIGQQFSGYTTVYLPSADDNPEKTATADSFA